MSDSKDYPMTCSGCECHVWRGTAIILGENAYCEKCAELDAVSEKTDAFRMRLTEENERLQTKLDAVRNGLHLPKITPEIEDLLQGSYLIESGDWTQDAVEFVCILAKAIADDRNADLLEAVEDMDYVKAIRAKHATLITALRVMAKGWIANRLPPDDPDYLIGESIAKSSCAADITALLEKHSQSE